MPRLQDLHGRRYPVLPEASGSLLVARTLDLAHADLHFGPNTAWVSVMLSL
jgi:hypothetical protein